MSDEYVFLTQIVPSPLYRAAEGKALQLNEAFERAGKDAEMQRPAQDQESLSPWSERGPAIITRWATPSGKFRRGLV
jgi:hypothetical protein